MSSKFSSPILLLIFNRPQVTQQVFNKIKEVKPQYLYVAADGPRANVPHEAAICEETRKIIDQVDWECEVKTLFRDKNLGCGFAVCSAISWFFDQVEEGIVLEDDCLPNASFFPFCSELLQKYRDDDKIFLISGTNMQNGIKRSDDSYYFSQYPITWGWASWRRAWKRFSYNIQDLDQVFKSAGLNHVFQSSQEKSYWREKLKKGVTEKDKIWDYQWWYAIWKNKGIAIVPNTNLIVNLGFRNTGSHIFLSDCIREPSTSSSMLFPLTHPINKIINFEADKFTYKNAYSHSFPRFLRLVRENGIKEVFKYTLNKVNK
jgi:hypothetical protein